MTDSPERDPKTGRILKGHTLNRRGRPLTARTVDEAILRAAQEQVTIKGKKGRRRETKLNVSAIQLTNQAAAGNLSALKIALELLRRAEERIAGKSSASGELPASDREIAERFITKLKRIADDNGGSK
jgi:hypothetical protein